MLLDGKRIVVYGAGGAVGGAVARAFAGEGAELYLAGRSLGRVESTAHAIANAGGKVHADQVDAMDEDQVERHLDDVVKTAGGIDVLFNAIGMHDVQGTSLIDIPVEDFARPVEIATRTQFLTARAAARRMVDGPGGLIMSITAEPSPGANLGGFPVACAVVESMWRSFASELGRRGVRSVVLRSAGSPDSPAVQEVFRIHSEATGEQFDAEQLGSHTMLGRLPLLAEVADVATLLASDRAGAMTAAIGNATCGAFFDL